MLTNIFTNANGAKIMLDKKCDGNWVVCMLSSDNKLIMKKYSNKNKIARNTFNKWSRFINI